MEGAEVTEWLEEGALVSGHWSLINCWTHASTNFWKVAQKCFAGGTIGVNDLGHKNKVWLRGGARHVEGEVGWHVHERFEVVPNPEGWIFVEIHGRDGVLHGSLLVREDGF